MTTTVNFDNLVEHTARLTNLTLDLCNKHDLSWTVEREKLISPSGRETASYGLFRSDNGAHLATLSERYVPCDNFELAKLLVFASQSIEDLDIENSNGGLFKQGQKVFFQIPLPNTTIGNANVTRYLSALNSHDGSSGVALGTTQTVVSCQNTFYRAYRATDMTRVGHNSNMRERLTKLVVQMEETIANDQLNIERFRKMLEIVPQKEDIKAMKDLMFSIEPNVPPSEISTRKSNLMKKFDQAVEMEFAAQGDNMWGLFNAVTRYTNHEMKTYHGNGKLENVMVGQGAKLNRMAFDRLSLYLN
jgi:hypothetical protein